MTDKKIYGQLLVALRERERISQKRLAQLLDVSAPAVCKWEKGDEFVPQLLERDLGTDIVSYSIKKIQRQCSTHKGAALPFWILIWGL
ncbi:MAG: helix-turn-helix domain-containing protein [Lachnospiraceae bacterium]|nr:helix-turn-helix domain-containing protein [Lachnospiraceae bacterium]